MTSSQLSPIKGTSRSGGVGGGAEGGGGETCGHGVGGADRPDRGGGARPQTIDLFLIVFPSHRGRYLKAHPGPPERGLKPFWCWGPAQPPGRAEQDACCFFSPGSAEVGRVGVRLRPDRTWEPRRPPAGEPAGEGRGAPPSRPARRRAGERGAEGVASSTRTCKCAKGMRGR